ncbi:uncharacterized protein LOC144707583 [Wolffia australiana]
MAAAASRTPIAMAQSSLQEVVEDGKNKAEPNNVGPHPDDQRAQISAHASGHEENNDVGTATNAAGKIGQNWLSNYPERGIHFEGVLIQELDGSNNTLHLGGDSHEVTIGDNKKRRKSKKGNKEKNEKSARVELIEKEESSLLKSEIAGNESEPFRGTALKRDPSLSLEGTDRSVLKKDNSLPGDRESDRASNERTEDIQKKGKKRHRKKKPPQQQPSNDFLRINEIKPVELLKSVITHSASCAVLGSVTYRDVGKNSSNVDSVTVNSSSAVFNREPSLIAVQKGEAASNRGITKKRKRSKKRKPLNNGGPINDPKSCEQMDTDINKSTDCSALRSQEDHRLGPSKPIEKVDTVKQGISSSNSNFPRVPSNSATELLKNEIIDSAGCAVLVSQTDRDVGEVSVNVDSVIVDSSSAVCDRELSLLVVQEGEAASNGGIIKKKKKPKKRNPLNNAVPENDAKLGELMETETNKSTDFSASHSQEDHCSQSSKPIEKVETVNQGIFFTNSNLKRVPSNSVTEFLKNEITDSAGCAVLVSATDRDVGKISANVDVIVDSTSAVCNREPSVLEGQEGEAASNGGITKKRKKPKKQKPRHNAALENDAESGEQMRAEINKSTDRNSLHCEEDHLAPLSKPIEKVDNLPRVPSNSATELLKNETTNSGGCTVMVSQTGRDVGETSSNVESVTVNSSSAVCNREPSLIVVQKGETASNGGITKKRKRPKKRKPLNKAGPINDSESGEQMKTEINKSTDCSALRSQEGHRSQPSKPIETVETVNQGIFSTNSNFTRVPSNSVTESLNNEITDSAGLVSVTDRDVGKVSFNVDVTVDSSSAFCNRQPSVLVGQEGEAASNAAPENDAKSGEHMQAEINKSTDRSSLQCEEDHLQQPCKPIENVDNSPRVPSYSATELLKNDITDSAGCAVLVSQTGRDVGEASVNVDSVIVDSSSAVCDREPSLLVVQEVDAASNGVVKKKKKPKKRNPLTNAVPENDAKLGEQMKTEINKSTDCSVSHSEEDHCGQPSKPREKVDSVNQGKCSTNGNSRIVPSNSAAELPKHEITDSAGCAVSVSETERDVGKVSSNVDSVTVDSSSEVCNREPSLIVLQKGDAASNGGKDKKRKRPKKRKPLNKVAPENDAKLGEQMKTEINKLADCSAPGFEEYHHSQPSKPLEKVDTVNQGSFSINGDSPRVPSTSATELIKHEITDSAGCTVLVSETDRDAGKISSNVDSVTVDSSSAVCSREPSILVVQEGETVSNGGITKKRKKPKKRKPLNNVLPINDTKSSEQMKTEMNKSTDNSALRSEEDQLAQPSKSIERIDTVNPENFSTNSNSLRVPSVTVELEGITASNDAIVIAKKSTRKRKRKTKACENASLVNEASLSLDTAQELEKDNPPVLQKPDHAIEHETSSSKKGNTFESDLGRTLTVPIKKKLLVLDLNGLLVDVVAGSCGFCRSKIKVSGKSVFKRPFCDEFVDFCFKNFVIGIWSSRMKRNLNPIVDYVFGKRKKMLMFRWDRSKCTFTGFKTMERPFKPLVLKELRLLWDNERGSLPWQPGHFSPSNTLLIDDSPYKALCNPLHTAIFPKPYCFKDTGDDALGRRGSLRTYLEALAMADDVQDYVSRQPFGQPAIGAESPSWDFYSKIIEKMNNKRLKKGGFELTCSAN